MAAKKKSAEEVLKEKKGGLLGRKTKPNELVDKFMYTDNVAFDIAVSNGKGLPLGVFLMIAAPKGVGKTSLCCSLMQNLLKKHKDNGIPFQVIYIDIEGSKTLANNFGLAEFIESGNLIHITGAVTYAELEELYTDVLKGKEEVKDVKLIFIDSIANVTTDKMIEKGVEDAHFGITAKAATEFFTKMTPFCVSKEITTIMINHEKVDQEAGKDFTGKSAKKEAGSDAAKYFSSALLRLSKKTSASNDGINKFSINTMSGKKEITDKFKVTIKSPDKNRFCNIGEVEMLVKGGARVIDEYPIKCILLNSGLVKNPSAGYYTLDALIAPEGQEDKKLTTKEFNKYISTNKQWFIEFLRQKDLYRWDLQKVEEDPDGYQG